MAQNFDKMSLVPGKSVFGVSDLQVGHKPGCTATEDGISDWIVLSTCMYRKQRRSSAADLRLCFCICKSKFSHDVAQILEKKDSIKEFFLLKQVQKT